MNLSYFDFVFIGGDMRQIYMANDLLNRNYSVTAYGLDDSLLDPRCKRSLSFEEAMNAGQIVIAPIPVSKDGMHIVSIHSQSDLTIKNLCNLLTAKHKLFGGVLPADLVKHCDTLNICYQDLMKQEEITLYNTIATAEGTIAEAILNSTTNLHDSTCLILGFGRCARTLAEKLNGLCGSVTIAARSPMALSAAYAASYGTISLSQLEEKIEEYDYIFNTIPALVLPKELLKKTRQNVVIIDIASTPGGTDFNYAKEIHRNAKLCLGLPGKYAPESSALALNNHILLNI
ncbi:dipicolinate synthase subunit DpsA [Anaerocolumna sp.]|uniref:dipicolinate synthase subunit DpsA n=1 Tax=Anaerocolumna sp. TaxID=2041569 RepID=UPI0028AFD3AC|nr:dipicolinate synthase subunit DpsA [Anaerocolumna sp.]